MSNCSLPDNPTFGELVGVVQGIQSNLAGFQELARRHQSVGDLLPRLESVCMSVNQLLVAVSDIQARLQKLENCQNGPVVVSVAPA